MCTTMLTEPFCPFQYGQTPLHLAARKGHTTYVERLLSTPGIDDDTPLHHAACEDHTACVERLLSTPGIDVNITDMVRQFINSS